MTTLTLGSFRRNDLLLKMRMLLLQVHLTVVRMGGHVRGEDLGRAHRPSNLLLLRCAMRAVSLGELLVGSVRLDLLAADLTRLQNALWGAPGQDSKRVSSFSIGQ